MPSTPEPLPSLPPSPTPTEDIAHAWHDDPEEPSGAGAGSGSGSASELHLSAPSSSAARKGKGKARGRTVSRERLASRSGSDEEDEEASAAAEGYPPTKEEEAESRRVEETLRRWEIAERQRRKAARESASSTTTPSLLADLRSSLFRRDSSRKVPRSGVGTHHVLRTDDRDVEGGEEHDNGVPLEDMQTPTGGVYSAPRTLEPENPFDTPTASRTSLNIPANSAIMTESDSIPAEFVASDAGTAPDKGPGPKRPTLEASTSFANAGARRSVRKQPAPPPKPLDLPAPRSPPPRTGTPRADKPPEPIPPPRPAPPEPEQEQVDEGPPVPWWHEWLCGCGEGPDRGGEHQAGRTNPFE
ncbi:hypothetical protein BD414DRAFT_513695 [Trametes punicea]|nr:hypothetical protein BD414DRAFT_513695 [Trametes punicea]